jgi:hypothetical protein
MGDIGGRNDKLVVVNWRQRLRFSHSSSSIAPAPAPGDASLRCTLPGGPFAVRIIHSRQAAVNSAWRMTPIGGMIVNVRQTKDTLDH